MNTSRTATEKPSGFRLPSFGVQVLLGLVLGVALGLVARSMGADGVDAATGEVDPNWLTETLATVGGTFVTLLRAVVPPLVFLAIVASIVLAAVLLLFALVRTKWSWPVPLVVAAASAVIAAGFAAGLQPSERIEFEDAHVVHNGGELYPHEYAVARFVYRGGWILHEGQSASFLAKEGPATLHYITGIRVRIQIGSRVYDLPPGREYKALPIMIDRTGRIVLRVLSGSVNLDRLEHR